MKPDKWAKHKKGFGKRLKTIREKQGLSLTKVADAAGITRSYLHELENSTNRLPTIYIAVDIATALGVSLPYLMGLENARLSKSIIQPVMLEFVEMKRKLARIEGICKGDAETGGTSGG